MPHQGMHRWTNDVVIDRLACRHPCGKACNKSGRAANSELATGFGHLVRGSCHASRQPCHDERYLNCSSQPVRNLRIDLEVLNGSSADENIVRTCVDRCVAFRPVFLAGRCLVVDEYTA
ncbi:hypothetical protein FRZ40_38085 [Paraburkholderia azotifigens]|uniref:Uncharacterized protein n=1 Tax=Paraburkholderia azotifigens TaxID=2057004 RepID=A0A5C6V5T6_9BURK|nr:hypothetical protein [Paraburkholderia azotifigens]TXC80120.1 hypothetical protein FRZ40_38085 [Paraburkholderia azotifigens]